MDQVHQSFSIPSFVENNLLKIPFGEFATASGTSHFARQLRSQEFWLKKCSYQGMPDDVLDKWKTVLAYQTNGELWWTLFKKMCYFKDQNDSFLTPMEMANALPDITQQVP